MFKLYNNKEDINEGSLTNWLYIFDIENTKELELPENTFKFGKTNTFIKTRLNQYEKNINMKNIEIINCNYPDKIERLLKGYLRKYTSLKPVRGIEYFSECREYIKRLILLFLSQSEEDIILNTTYYSQQDIKYTDFFNKIKEKENEELVEFNINIENNMIMESNKCEYCNKEYSSKGILETHQKTAKFCLRLRNNKEKEIKTFKCEFCEDNFNLKHVLERHHGRCKIKKINDKENSIVNELKDELLLLKTKYEYEIKMKDEQIKMKEEYHLKEQKMKDEIIYKLEKEVRRWFYSDK